MSTGVVIFPSYGVRELAGMNQGNSWEQLWRGSVPEMTVVQAQHLCPWHRAPHSPLCLLLNILLISDWLSPSWVMRTQVIGERGGDCSGFFRLGRGNVGARVPMPVLCQDAFMEIDNFHGMIRWLVSASSLCKPAGILVLASCGYMNTLNLLGDEVR